MKWILLAVFISLSSVANARMYQWIDAHSGTPQLSGGPPVWYRSTSPGPRVVVFEDGRLLDDTELKVSPERRKALREAAYREYDERKQLGELKRLEQLARREESLRRRAALAEKGAEEAKTEDKTEETPENLDQATIDRLKALISSFDKQNTGTPPPASK